MEAFLKHAPSWFFGIGLCAVAAVVGVQMYRGDAIVCADGAIFAKTCSPNLEGVPTVDELKAGILSDPEAVATLKGDTGNQGKAGPEGPPGPMGLVEGFANAVVAFDQNGCPDGWVQFTDAAGRAIIGAGNGTPSGGTPTPQTSRTYREHGGEEAVTLTEAHIPNHYHNVPFVPEVSNLSGNSYPVMSSLKHSATARSHVATGSYGASGAHNNMPPYIALYFCKKGAN